MRILSTNISRPQIIIFNGKEELTGYFKQEVHYPVYLTADGIKNDCMADKVHHGGKDKACYLYSSDHYPFWKRQYPDLSWDYGMFGENLTVDGLDESAIGIGDTFRVGEAVIQVSQPRQPCYKMGIKFNDMGIVKKFCQAPYPGTYVRVLKEGFVKRGDGFELIAPGKSGLCVSEVFVLLYSQKPDAQKYKRALEDELLAVSAKNHLQKKLAHEPG